MPDYFLCECPENGAENPAKQREQSLIQDDRWLSGKEVNEECLLDNDSSDKPKKGSCSHEPN